MSEAQSRASTKWNRSRDCITLRPDKETGKRIRKAADEAGLSIQQYILSKLEQDIERQSEV